MEIPLREYLSFLQQHTELSAYLIWELRCFLAPDVLRGHSGEIYAVAITPDGERIVTGSWDNTARVWNLKTGVCEKVLEGHSDTILAVTITPNGKTIVTGSGDETVRIWSFNRHIA
jgi:WD40 repeat protein